MSRIRRFLVAWEATYSVLRDRQYGRRPTPLFKSLWEATTQAWRLTRNGGVLRRLRDTDVIG